MKRKISPLQRGVEGWSSLGPAGKVTTYLVFVWFRENWTQSAGVFISFLLQMLARPFKKPSQTMLFQRKTGWQRENTEKHFWFNWTEFCKNSPSQRRINWFVQCHTDTLLHSHTVSVINLRNIRNRSSWRTLRGRDIAKYCAINRWDRTDSTWNVPGHRVIIWKLS